MASWSRVGGGWRGVERICGLEDIDRGALYVHRWRLVRCAAGPAEGASCSDPAEEGARCSDPAVWAEQRRICTYLTTAMGSATTSLQRQIQPRCDDTILSGERSHALLSDHQRSSQAMSPWKTLPMAQDMAPRKSPLDRPAGRWRDLGQKSHARPSSVADRRVGASRRPGWRGVDTATQNGWICRHTDDCPNDACTHGLPCRCQR